MTQHPITPKILHKDCTEDVLLKNFDLILPALIGPEETVALKSGLAFDEIGLLNKAYRSLGDQLFLRAAPTHIPLDAVESADSFQFDLSQFYENTGLEWRITSSTLPSNIAQYFARFSEADNLSTEQRMRLATLMATRIENGICPINRYDVLNDTTNYFFYRKSHEHVPGLMLIEIARQAMYHYFYNHSGYARGDVSISISSLEVEFSSYVESAYDLEVVVTQTQMQARKQPRFVDKTASFYQNGRLVSRVRLQGGAMKMKLFKRMRTLKFPSGHWFLPSARVQSSAFVTDVTGALQNVRIEALSMSAVRLASAPKVQDDLRSLTFHVEGHGFLTLPLVGPGQDCGDGQHEISFADLSAEQRYDLQETIKCHCFFTEDASVTVEPAKLAATA